jgi:hypothetical protein
MGILHVVVLVSLLFAAFNNCSQVVTNSGEAASTSTAQGALQSPPQGYSQPLSTAEVAAISKSCADARSQGLMVPKSQTIVFHESSADSGRKQVCEFGKDGNDATFQGLMQARYEQKRFLEIPPNAVVCDMELQTLRDLDDPTIKYDDVFLLSLNGSLIATNNETAIKARLQTSRELTIGNGKVSIYRYDWAKLKGHPFKNKEDDYCVGSNLSQSPSICSWPVTENQGDFKLNIKPELVIALANGGQGTQEFNLAVTGDNDKDIDCRHTGMEFNVKIEYFIKPAQ